MKWTITLLIILLSNIAYANSVTFIAGNPINRQDNYTVNTNAARWVDIHCTFTNTGKQPAILKVWTRPYGTIPDQSIRLKPATRSYPFTIDTNFRVQLKKQWWCLLNVPKNNKKDWEYCSYFAISDATISRYKPFKTWNKTIHSRDTSYYCKLTNPNRRIRFFSFSAP